MRSKTRGELIGLEGLVMAVMIAGLLTGCATGRSEAPSPAPRTVTVTKVRCPIVKVYSRDFMARVADEIVVGSAVHQLITDYQKMRDETRALCEEK